MPYLISNFKFPVSASGFQFDNTPHFGKKCKLENEGCLYLLDFCKKHVNIKKL